VLSIQAMSDGQAGYYLGLAREDYYLEGGEPPGQWYGKGAAQLGLSGTVIDQHLYNVFDGLSKDGTKSLVQSQQHVKRADHMPGWDLTFSAPKSVSVLWSQCSEGGRRKIQEAHLEAVKAALDYLEETVGYSRRGQNGRELQRSGLAFALFEHSTSRAMDANLHTHALLMNVAVRPDGFTGAATAYGMFQAKMAAGALYRAHFSATLEIGCGIPVERDRFAFAITGIPKDLVRERSKRREDVEAELARQGESGARASAMAAVITRGSKGFVSRPDLFQDAEDAGGRFGFHRDDADGLFGRALIQRDKGEELRRAAVVAAETLTSGQSYFTEMEFFRRASEECQTRGLLAPEIREFVSNHLSNSPDIVRLGSFRGQVRYTTKEMFEREADLMRDVEILRSNTRHQLSADNVLKQLSRDSGLSEEQTKAFFHITYETGAIAVVSGVGGSGKTRMLKEARIAWEREGLLVEGAAIMSRAANQLESESGISSKSVAKLLYDINQGQARLNEKSVIVLDEAGMVGTQDFGKLTKAVKDANAKLVIVGHRKQIQPIDAGAPFAEIGERVGQAELKTSRRQKEPWMRDAAEAMSQGNADDALRAYASRGYLSVSRTQAEAMRSLVEKWRADGLPSKDTLILAGTRREVSELNRLAQATRLESGHLSGPSIEHRGSRLFQGDRVQFEKTSRARGIDNGDRGTIESINSVDRTVRVRLDGGERLTVAVSDYQEISLGYASTTHKAQGATTRNAYVLVGGHMQDRELSYVQISRAQDQTHLFATQAVAGDTLTELARSMSVSREKDMALSILRKQELILRNRESVLRKQEIEQRIRPSF